MKTFQNDQKIKIKIYYANRVHDTQYVLAAFWVLSHEQKLAMINKLVGGMDKWTHVEEVEQA